jgi:hypothetical protein
VSDDKVSYLPARGARPGADEPPPSTAGIEVVEYYPAQIHDGVSIVQLISALNRGGFTISNVDARGLVIHRIGQHPERPPHQPLPRVPA